MIFENHAKCKIYFDGSHYIAIIPRKRYRKHHQKKPEQEFVVLISDVKIEEELDDEINDILDENYVVDKEPVDEFNATQSTIGQAVKANLKGTTEVKMTRKEIFNMFYKERLSLRKKERRKALIEDMRPYFATDEETALYVDKKLEEKQNNLIRKRIRLSRKCRLQEFNYFVTFTYDDKLHTEQSFKKSIMRCLRHLCERKGWRYLGVWERGGKNERLHYHALLYVPENTMPGTMFETNDFNFKRHTRKTVTQNTYFVANFGRCEFDEVHNTWEQADCLRYLMKYLEKSGERITSSKGVKEFFVSDILEEDILMQYGFDEYKVILSDDFQCIMDGELLGRVSPELIRYLIEAENMQNKKGS